MIAYTTQVADLGPDQLTGFFVDWPDPPSAQTLLRLLEASDSVWLAVDDGPAPRVVGFVTAVTDGILTAYIPLLEVLPAHQGRGIGSELVRRMLATLGHLYAVDLVCDDALRPFYERFGMTPHGAMVLRNYDRQSGARVPQPGTSSPT